MSSLIYNVHLSAPEQSKTQSVTINKLSASRTARPAYAAASLRPEPARLATHRTPAASYRTLGTWARHGMVLSAGRLKGEHVILLATHHEGHETGQAGPELRATDLVRHAVAAPRPTGARFQKGGCGAGRMTHASPPIVSDQHTAQRALRTTLHRRNIVPPGRSMLRRTESRLWMRQAYLMGEVCV